MKLFVNYYGYRANLYLIMKVSMFVCVLAGNVLFLVFSTEVGLFLITDHKNRKWFPQRFIREPMKLFPMHDSYGTRQTEFVAFPLS